MANGWLLRRSGEAMTQPTSTKSADERATSAIELVRCAQINLNNFFKMYPNIVNYAPQLRMVKHQLDCAVANLDGEPEPEFMP